MHRRCIPSAGSMEQWDSDIDFTASVGFGDIWNRDTGVLNDLILNTNL
jgi:hypothetical protein